MLLQQVLESVEYSGKPPLDMEIEDIAYSSKKAGNNILFVCLNGSRVDGHNFAPDAYEKGCRIFICQHEISLPKDSFIIIVKNSRAVLATISANFFCHPSKKLAVIGVTGTKGKTTIVHIVKDMLDSCGIKTGRIGTVGASYGNVTRATVNTTPESYETQKLLYEMVNDGCKAVAMEVSSIGVKAHRIDNIKFAIGIFTNISPDHIGGHEHESFEEYYSWKKAFFDMCDVAIGCADDEATQDMIEKCSEKLLYGLDKVANFKASNVRPFKSNSFLGTSFDLDYNGKQYYDMKISLPGDYSVYNALAAIAVCSRLGIDIESVRKPLSQVSVSGRTEPVLISDECS
ncbi:MAG: Mur ligase family protein, partial [Oscillospiraceae bacterium]